MKALMIGACLAAVAGAPAFAQPYDQDQPDPYYDPGQQPPPQQPYGQGGYQQRGGDQDENGYGQPEGGAYQPPPPPPAGQPGFQVYQGGPQDQPQPRYQGGYEGYGQYPAPQYGYQSYAPQRAYGYASGAARYTGRSGPAWRNEQGQYCVWREMTWLDQGGRPAYRWTPRCR